MFWLLSLVGFLALGYVGLCLFYALFQERFIFIRFRTKRAHRYAFSSPHEERYLTTPDGATLHALYFKATTPRGLLIYFHGNTGSLKRWGKFAPRFVELGYDVLMPDPRGYGKSRGELSEKALHADADRWYEHALQHWKGTDIVLFGRSLGSGLATPLAAKRTPRLLILETPFANLYELAMNYLPILPYRFLLRYPFRNDQAMKRMACPVYILHGKLDNVVPYGSALRLYSLVPANLHREMITFSKGHHSDLHRFRRYQRFLERVLA